MVSNTTFQVIERSVDNVTYSQLGTTTKNAYVDVNLNNLVRYYYRVKTQDTLSNISRPTTVLSSQPGAAPDVVATPQITVYNWKQEFGVWASVEWATDQLADSFVAYSKVPLEEGSSTKTKSGQTAQVVGQFDKDTAHRVLVQQLEPSTKYYFKTLSQNEVKITGASEIIEITTPERIPLTLAGLRFENTTPTSTQVVWTTNKPSTTVLEYGKVPAYGSALTDRDLNIDHVMTLDNLESGVTYHLRIQATDADENTTQSDDYMISIPATPLIESTQVSDLKFNSATISWVTNVNTDSQVAFGLEGGKYTSQQGKSDMTTLHQVTLIGLDPAKQYHYKISSKDQFNNVAESVDKTFTTPADLLAPAISKVKSEVTTSGSGENIKIMAIISWETDESATSQVEYGMGLSGEYPNNTEEVLTYNQTHTVIIPDLKPNASYQYRIVSKDAAGNTAKGEDLTLITPAKEKSLLQLVVKSLEETFAWTKRLREAPLIKRFIRD